jgi:hypothetical protein
MQNGIWTIPASRTKNSNAHSIALGPWGHTKRLKVDFEIAEAMLNHVKRGLERTYDQYEFDLRNKI